MNPAKKALEFKGRMLSLTRVRVLDPDSAAIDAQLREFARQMPQAVQGMPVILESDNPIELGGILAALREVGMQPIGVGSNALAESARSWGLPVLQGDSGARPAKNAVPPPSASAVPVAQAARKPARLITEPVRSGQQVYAQDSDLIVMSTVNVGAEVIADGCIHIYGALRGRAVAGGKGDTTARVFCRRFEPELIAIAGVYAVAEQMQGDLRNKPAQAYLADGKLKLERLEW